jgi:hypothetical protein
MGMVEIIARSCANVPATIGLILLVTVDLHPLTLLFVAAATGVTITSRLLYSPQHDQKLNGDQDSE